MGISGVRTNIPRESSFKVTRGDEDIEGGSEHFWARKGSSENLYTSTPTGVGGSPKKMNR